MTWTKLYLHYCQRKVWITQIVCKVATEYKTPTKNSQRQHKDQRMCSGQASLKTFLIWWKFLVMCYNGQRNVDILHQCRTSTIANAGAPFVFTKIKIYCLPVVETRRLHIGWFHGTWVINQFWRGLQKAHQTESTTLWTIIRLNLPWRRRTSS